jgi:hypothetical protein
VTGLNILSTGIKETVLNVSGLNTLSTGARPRSSYDARHQTLQCSSQIEHSAVLSQVMRGFKYCKELMSTMKLKLGRVSEVEVSRASLLFANVLVFK